MFAHVNWIATIVATVVGFMLGFVWYHPKVFGKAWMESVGIDPDNMDTSNLPAIMGIAFVMTFVICTFLGRYPHENAFHGAFHALIPFLAYVLPIIVCNAVYEKRSFKFILITAGYWFVAFVVMAVTNYGIALALATEPATH